VKAEKEIDKHVVGNLPKGTNEQRSHNWKMKNIAEIGKGNR
jgi:hypothetical protein